MNRRHALVSLATVLAFALPAALAARGPAPQGFAAFDGRPHFEEGSELSYYVWHEGSTWKVRWTTNGGAREFTGSVRGVGGALKDLKRIDVEAELKVIRAGRPARVVRGPAGRVRGVAPGRAPVVASKTQDHITKVDEHLIHWNTRTVGDIDGFDFKVDEVSALTFELKVEGDSRPRTVEIGRDNVHPNDNPFTVRIR